MTVLIGDLGPGDREGWERLWAAYLAFSDRLATLTDDRRYDIEL